MPKSQPALWAAKPDIAAFDKSGGGHLAEAQRHLDRMLAVKGTRNIENTLRPFDSALEQINAANYFAQLMQHVHPDAKFRDAATEMTRKASAAATAVSLNRELYHALTALDVHLREALSRMVHDDSQRLRRKEAVHVQGRGRHAFDDEPCLDQQALAA